MARDTFKVVDGKMVDDMAESARAQVGAAAEKLTEQAEYAREAAVDYARDAAASFNEQAGRASMRAAEYARKAADVMAEQAGYATARAGEYARRAAELVEDWSQEGLENFRGAVKDRPVQWAVISVAAGAALGGLLAMWLYADNATTAAKFRKVAAQAKKRIPVRRAKS